MGSVEVFSPRTSNPYAAQRRVDKDDLLDPVTGLPPRHLGELNLQALMRAVAEGVTTLGVLFIDVDHFKDINDTFGHKTGDDVLRMVAQSTANGLRRSDVPIRWGGDEFLVLLPGIDQAGLHATAERVRILVENSWIQEGGTQARVSVSIGATMALPAETVDDLVARSDRLMYTSKHGGRNRGTSDTGELTSTADARSSAPVSSCRCPEYATWTDSVPESRVPENRSWHVDQPAAGGIVRPGPVWIHAVIALRHSSRPEHALRA